MTTMSCNTMTGSVECLLLVMYTWIDFPKSPWTVKSMQGDRQKLLQLLTGYELAVTGHEGYAKVRVLIIELLFCSICLASA